MNRVCDLAPTRAISLVPGWTVLPSLPSFQGAPCSGNMLLPATTWDLHIPGESFSERHRRGGLRYVPAQAGLFGGGLPGSSPQRGLGWVFIQPQKRQRQENSTHAAGKHHRMLQAYVKPPA